MRNLIAGGIGVLVWYLMFSFVVMEFPLRFAEWSQEGRVGFLYFGAIFFFLGVCIYNMVRSYR